MKPRSWGRAATWVGLGAILVAIGDGRTYGQQDPAVLAGVNYLKHHYANQPPGESAMIALGLLKAEVPHSDPVLEACVAAFRARFTSGAYEPQRTNGQGVYEAAAAAMALANLDAVSYRGELSMITTYLLSQQRPNGSWDYTGRDNGDASITQYAVLGLWEAENAGIEVSPSVWERTASWYLSKQRSSGAWVYHDDEPQYTETLSMTAAGVGSLLICQLQLDRYRQRNPEVSPLLKPLANNPLSEFRPSIPNQRFDQAVRRGMDWISSHFAPDNPTIAGQSPFYMLYGLERIGALADRGTIGRLDWFDRGRKYIHSKQQSDGSWSAHHTSEMNTVWAILFITKSTAKTLRRIKIQRLSAGTLLGGRGLPSDLSSMTVAGGRVVSRPMNGAIEGMLAVLEDPRAEKADAAVAGLVDRYYREGPGALRPYKLRFRKMLTDRDPGLRRVAAWSLAHTGDMDVVPALIQALTDPDEDVVNSARLGLQILSRKVEGLGPPNPSTPEERRAAAAKWREWFNAIRPLDLDDDDNPAPRPPATSTGPAAGSPAGSPKP